MSFDSGYLEQSALFPELIKEEPDKNTGIIVVVPAYDEPGIDRLLDSLSLCSPIPCSIEILIIVNAPDGASPGSIRNNKKTLENIETWKRHNPKCFFRVYSILADTLHLKGWGVGMARKTGMDEAARRFGRLNNPDGVILNLDADCLVAENYFVSVYNDFLMKKNRSACSIYFEHPLSGKDFPLKVYDHIALYELHLRYYFQGLLFSGFPYVFHTVGSAFGVKALHYVKSGGMNRKQAGEDFYFIQKLVPAGGYFTLNSTIIYPSPRPSFRVPFGTGASINKLSVADKASLPTYNLLAFKELRSFFLLIDNYLKYKHEFEQFYLSLPDGVKSFLDEKELFGKLEEIRNNTSGFESGRKRFFGWFNMFRVVKYLNHVHSGIFEKKHVLAAASELLEENGILWKSDDPKELLLRYRSLEQTSTESNTGYRSPI